MNNRNKTRTDTNFSGSIYTFIVFMFLLQIAFTSCASKTRTPLPKVYSGEAQIEGMSTVRDFWGQRSEYFQTDFEDSIRQYLSTRAENYEAGSNTVNILAISGGGSNGAFGVGLINGWGASGTRPTFNVVTGISTGALIAPFAFLGGEYDKEIGRLFTTTNTDMIYKNKSFLGTLGSILGNSDSLTDSSPLVELLAEYLDDEMLSAIAKAHSQGRRLFVATTNLDARKLVIWNMGAIASSNHPDAIKLFRKVILASASMPIAFPAVYIDVGVDGKKYDEMHVDGGVITEVFFYADVIDIEQALINVGIKNKPDMKIFIIRNNQIEAQYQEVEINLLSIAGKSLSSLTSTQGVGDLYRIYLLTQRDGVDFNLASIPSDFVPNAMEAFDPVEMKRLYDLGYNMALTGYPWEKFPPMYHE